MSDFRQRVNTVLGQRGLPTIPSSLDHAGLSPYPAWTLSTACFASAVASLRGTPGWAGMFPLAGFAGAFAVSGYATLIDHENGPSMATAWGSVYLFFFGRSSLQALRPGPALLTAGVAGTTFLYGREFFDLWFG
ncbi:hypothetical protein BC830DRAFT_1155723 [Chytriomyces sp. MP71]|nr:hypothetical protein BC830DRAFT_1155723 [Chytriomyces sp. MP71]